MKNLPLLLGTIFGTLILIFGVAFFFSGDGSTQPGAQVDAALVEGESRNTKGAEVAAVTIVEFSDFQCPACRAAQPLVEQITAEYADQVRLVFRHFPLDTIHPNARLAAQAAEVAAEYGKFWEYHDLLFANQEEWSSISARAQLREQLALYAEQLEIDKTEFETKIESEEVAATVQSDVTAGQQAGVNATPTFYVNGQQTAAPQLRATVESFLNTEEAQ